MKRVLNFRVVEGDPNEVDKNEILLVRDNPTGKVKSIRKRGSDGSLEHLIPVPDDYIYCRATSWDTDLTDDGQRIWLEHFLEFFDPLVSSSLVKLPVGFICYLPFRVMGDFEKNGHNVFTEIRAIRIYKAVLAASEDGSKFIKLNTLDDLQNILLTLTGLKVDLSKSLKPITKDEFDSMEIPTLR